MRSPKTNSNVTEKFSQRSFHCINVVNQKVTFWYPVRTLKICKIKNRNTKPEVETCRSLKSLVWLLLWWTHGLEGLWRLIQLGQGTLGGGGFLETKRETGDRQTDTYPNESTESKTELGSWLFTEVPTDV